jgi:phosphatidylglycerophosphatase A
VVDDQRKQTLSDRLVVAIATQVLVTLFLIGVGIVVADQAARVIGGQDPPAIVIDEIAGIAVATLLLPPQVQERVVAFVIFRLFDVIKPFPARQAERLPGGFGIVGDDLIAGLYTNLLVRVWLLLS